MGSFIVNSLLISVIYTFIVLRIILIKYYKPALFTLVQVKNFHS